MDELIPGADSQIEEIAQRVSERQKKAPNVSIEMVDGTARLTIGENSDADDSLKLMVALGTYELHFLSPLLSQISNSVSKCPIQKVTFDCNGLRFCA
jgi:hypothetical protein